MQFFGSTFGSTPVTIDIYPSNVTDRKYRDGVSGASGMPQRQYIYSTGEDIAGDVKIGVGGGRKLDHLGIKIELKGVIGVFQIAEQGNESVCIYHNNRVYLGSYVLAMRWSDRTMGLPLPRLLQRFHRTKADTLTNSSASSESLPHPGTFQGFRWVWRRG